MSERVIAKRLNHFRVVISDEEGWPVEGGTHRVCIVDPDAPSVSEIVEVLREVYEGEPKSDDVFLRIAGIIARLE